MASTLGSDHQSLLVLTDSGAQYSEVVGFVYVFNLIVGTGALTMPAAFKEAGWLLSLIAIIVLAFMSYMTLTFMTETMAISNAKLRFQQVLLQSTVKEESGDVSVNVSERQPLLKPQTLYSDIQPSFEITHRVEMGSMAALFFNKVGMIFFHLCIIIYLYGDLAIYSVAVPKSLRDVVCTFQQNRSNVTNSSMGNEDLCWSTSTITTSDAYRIFVAVFVILLGPFTFFNVQKTKYLQIVTSLARWTAFLMMIVFTCIRLADGQGQGHPVVADVAGVPNLFGVCVYSFMCHHSLPSLITPIRNKSRLLTILAGNYSLILVFYLVLSFTAVFAIDKLEDLYTLNFKPNNGDSSLISVVPIQYFLALFPVFTLSTSFPIISITLRNNLTAMITPRHGRLPWFVPKIICPLVVLLPPVVVALATDQVEVLVGITGSYAGTGIQYVIPAVLVLLARRDTLAVKGDYKHRSPFSHKLWVVLTLIWSCICVIFVTANYIRKLV